MVTSMYNLYGVQNEFWSIECMRIFWFRGDMGNDGEDEVQFIEVDRRGNCWYRKSWWLPSIFTSRWKAEICSIDGV